MDPAADLSSFCRKEYWLLKTSFGNWCLYWASSLTFGIPCTLQDLLQYKNEFKGVYIYFFFQLLLLTTFYHSWLWCKDDLIVKYLLGYICQKKGPNTGKVPFQAAHCHTINQIPIFEGKCHSNAVFKDNES